jgi:hypothetical protein
MKAVLTEDYYETVEFKKNEDGTFSLTFEKLPSLLFVSYDGRGMYDQLFVQGKYKPEIQGVSIESSIHDLTSYKIDYLAAVEAKEEN